MLVTEKMFCVGDVHVFLLYVQNGDVNNVFFTKTKEKKQKNYTKKKNAIQILTPTHTPTDPSVSVCLSRVSNRCEIKWKFANFCEWLAFYYLKIKY